MITQQKWKKLHEQMERLKIDELELEENFERGSGSGGQKINKTSSCVQLIYRAQNLEIRCQKTRSQADNRYWARRELCEQMEERLLGEKSKRQQAIEKIRRQKRRRSRRAKAKMLKDKGKQAEKKARRGRISPDE